MRASELEPPLHEGEVGTLPWQKLGVVPDLFSHCMLIFTIIALTTEAVLAAADVERAFF